MLNADEMAAVMEDIGPMTCTVSDKLVDVLERRLKDLTPAARKRFNTFMADETRQRSTANAHLQQTFDQLREALDDSDEVTDLAAVRLLCAACVAAIDSYQQTR